MRNISEGNVDLVRILFFHWGSPWRISKDGATLANTWNKVKYKFMNSKRRHYVKEARTTLSLFMERFCCEDIVKRKIIVTVSAGVGVGEETEIIPYFNVWLEVEEQFWGNANMHLYKTIGNTRYKWTWDGFVFLGYWFGPHIGSIQYNITPTGSGDMWGVGYIAIVMKPLPFMLRGEPARILIYVLPEFEWNCLTISYLFLPAIGSYTVRDGTAFILGDNYAFDGTTVVHGDNGYNYTNTYGGADAYIWFVPKKFS